MPVAKNVYGRPRALFLYSCLVLAAACNGDAPPDSNLTQPQSVGVGAAGQQAAIDAAIGCSKGCAGGACVNNACVCPSNLLLCSGSCVDTANSATSCGACGRACGATDICQLGTCVPAAAQCTPACGTGQQCVFGVCQCAAGLSFCGGVCLDPLTTPQHCGQCDNACLPAQLCQAGQCVCAPGQTACAGQCIDAQTSSLNCGLCGQACIGDEVCMAGKCRAPLGPDGCAGTAREVSLAEVSAYQSVKIPLTKANVAIATAQRLVSVVQARSTLFRVGVTVGATFVPRELSARVTIKNGATMDQYFARQMVTKTSTDADSASTFQVTVPAEKISAATTYSVELVECGDAMGAVQAPRFPAMGDAPLEARKTGGLKITVVPLVSNSNTPDTSPATLKIYQDFFMSMYPIEQIEITVGKPMNIAYPVDWDSTIDQLRMRRSADKPAADVYYYGMLKPLPTLKEYCKGGCTAGVGYVGAVAQPQTRVALGLAFGDELSAGVMAHEVGHNHGRNHAPCAPGNNISGVDSKFPDKKANIGDWGYDLRSKTFFAPDKAKDIMGYCDPKWISDYTYKGLVDRVAAMNMSMLVLSDESLNQRYQVLLLTAKGPRWSKPFAEPDQPFGEPEQADVLDIDGQPIDRVTVYRTQLSDGVGSTVLVPEPQAGWNAIRVAEGASLPFSAPITVQ